MPLSLTSEFTANDIHTVSLYKKQTVYLLKGNGDDIVVKKEVGITADRSKHFDLSKKAMASVDSSVKSSKKLTDNEVNALITVVLRQKSLVQFRLKDKLPGATEDLDFALESLRNGSQKNLWYKMPNLRVFNMQSALEAQIGKTEGSVGESSEDITQSDQPMRDFIKALKASGGLESLGKVISIDMFSGNTDRFRPDGGRRTIIGEYKHGWKTLQNVGNLMIIGSGKAKTITGMDFADPASIMIEADKTLNEQTMGGEWFGDYIIDAGRRKQFANDIIEDLEYLLSPSRKKTFFQRGNTALGSNAAKRIEAGMVSGASILTKMVREKMRTKLKVYPPSFLERIALYEKLT